MLTIKTAAKAESEDSAFPRFKSLREIKED